jgi:hypothetical protein
MRKIFKFLLLFILIISPLSLFSQEIVNGLVGNAIAEKYYSSVHISRKVATTVDTVELPFTDDFSDSDVEPKPALWADNFAFINSTYAVNAPSVGVATLDALNYDGSQYPGAKSTPYQADYLTSQPVNLNYSVSDSIYLSFYFQPGGLAEPPEIGDSLILDFYSVDSLSWNKTWSAPGTISLEAFKRVMIKIDDPKYLKKGFRFRFRNYASQPENPDWFDKKANADLWHIDYVKIDKNRQTGDTILRDVAFLEPITGMLKEYTSLPWLHFEMAKNTQRSSFIEVTIQNHDSISRNIGTVLEIRDLLNVKPVYKVPANSAYFFNLASGDSIHYKFANSYPFDFSVGDSGAFEIRTILKTDNFDYKPNDTLRHIQKFYDYYSLDDGTAEASYGLRGSGTKDASSALKFNSFKGDSLRAVDMYFVQLEDSANLDFYFYLSVWADNNGKPGTQLVNQIGMRPIYSDRLNKFVRYKLEVPVFIQGAFYIGFTNTVERLLNVGLDLNRANQAKIFNNSSNGIWKTTTTLPGTPMMRPVFRENAFVGIKVSTTTPVFTAYPNPANETLNISMDVNYSFSAINRIELIDISGRIVRSAIPESNSIMNTGDLENGMYFLRLSDPASRKSSTVKIIISH